MKERERYIEHGHHRGQAHLDVGLQAVMDALEIAHDGHHRQSGSHTHAFIPGAFGIQFAVVRNALHTAEAIVGQDNAPPVHLFNDRMEVLIRDIHGVPIPGNHFALLIEQTAQLDADTPAAFILALLPHLLGAAAFSDGKEQFNGIAVDHREETWHSQYLITPVLAGSEQTQQPTAIGQTREQMSIVPIEPAIKHPEIHAFQGEQDDNCQQLTGIQFGLTVFGHGFRLIIDKAKNLNDNVFGCHEGLHSSESVFGLPLVLQPQLVKNRAGEAAFQGKSPKNRYVASMRSRSHLTSKMGL